MNFSLYRFRDKSVKNKKYYMNVNNLYSFQDRSLNCSNCIIHLQNYSFWVSYLVINYQTKKNYLYSDEWLYLINYNYPNYYYTFYANHYNTIIEQLNSPDIVYYNKNVISLFTTFSRGSVHGYSGFFYTLITFLKNIELYKDLDIILYDQCENGMKTIINHLSSLSVIKNNIIYLKENVKYKFDSVVFIPNEYHVFNGNLQDMMTEFIQKYIIQDRSYENENYCIIKTNMNSNITNTGLFDENILKNFCDKYNIFKITFPFDEIDLINRIYRCKILIISYGSTFFKNFVYISDYCEKVIVVVSGPIYIKDYLHLRSITLNKFQGIIHKKYKNATFHYIVTNNPLNFNPIML